MITDAQLDRIVAQATPGARLLGAEPLGERTLRLELRGARPVVLRLGGPPDPGAGDPLAAEAAALRALRAEIDLPLPELLAHDLEGESGAPFLLTSYLEGVALPEALPALNEDQRYAVGRALGEVVARAHSYVAPAYGALDPTAPPEPGREPPEGRAGDLTDQPDDEDVRYMRARLDAAVAAAVEAGELDPDGAARIAAWAAGNLAGTGRPACLVHGDLRPARLLLRRRERGWALAGLTGWGFAMAWRPAWDHVGAMEHFAGDNHFGLRVGYGNAYDATTERRYDQLREFALAPFRLILFLEAGRPDLALALLRQGDEA
ncbi:MAG TPA: phosphotransferase [Chloroflexaceae bacterium]|nr:phosphotransferase [Chloroflexaceae bacterium]